MPELPDLEVFSHNLQKKLGRKKIRTVRVLNRKKIKSPAIKKHIEGAVLKKVYREGKELRFRFSNGDVLGMHLMLHGRLNLFRKKNEQKNTVLELHFSDDTGLALSDYQGNATATLNPEEKVAPDALSAELTEAYLKEKLSKKRTAIKKFLLDQNMVRGIGNAYADEILWQARISPFSICSSIPAAKIRSLLRAIRQVLTDAQKKIRKKDPGIISGEVRDFLRIHNAHKKTSPGGAPIRHAQLGGRITYFTDEQVEYGK